MSDNSNIRKIISEAVGQAMAAPVRTKKVVKFDTDTAAPFQVLFSKRGFSIAGTRLSFEFIRMALNKELSITLNTGLVLDAVKMQKILRYEVKETPQVPTQAPNPPIQ